MQTGWNTNIRTNSDLVAVQIVSLLKNGSPRKTGSRRTPVLSVTLQILGEMRALRVGLRLKILLPRGLWRIFPIFHAPSFAFDGIPDFSAAQQVFVLSE